MLSKTMMMFALMGLILAGSVQADESWTEDLAAAKEAAKKGSKIIVADFTGSDWCGFCKKQHAEVFDTDAFKAWAKENAVLLTVDFPSKKQLSDETKKQNATLKEKFAIRGFPTVIFMNEKGEELGRFVGYRPGSGADAWLGKAKDIVAGKTEKAGQ
ncbi:MAG: thioredoxin family protein [Phycisphaeraceae bacterium]